MFRGSRDGLVGEVPALQHKEVIAISSLHIRNQVSPGGVTDQVLLDI